MLLVGRNITTTCETDHEVISWHFGKCQLFCWVVAKTHYYNFSVHHVSHAGPKSSFLIHNRCSCELAGSELVHMFYWAQKRISVQNIQIIFMARNWKHEEFLSEYVPLNNFHKTELGTMLSSNTQFSLMHPWQKVHMDCKSSFWTWTSQRPLHAQRA